MHQQAEIISRRFLNQFNGESSHITLSDLEDAGFPAFVYKRLRFRIQEKIEDEFFPDRSEWVDITTPEVQNAWPNFKAKLLANVRITPKKCRVLCQAEIGNILRVLTEPRSHLADYIFGEDEVLQFNDIQERTNQLTVYKHFGRAIPLYMQKRGLDTLTKERCRLLIEKLDANLVKDYQTKDWVQLLEPLFQLSRGEVDAELLQRFFEDKELQPLAAKLQAEEGAKVDKEQFVRLMEKPAKTYSNTKQDVAQNGRKQTDEATTEHPSPSPQKNEEELSLADSYLGDESPEQETREPERDMEDSFNALFREDKNRESFFEAFEEEMEAEQSEEESASISWGEEETERASEPDLFDAPEEDLAESEAGEDEDIQAIFSNEHEVEPDEANKKEPEEEGKDTPIWHQFMSEEELAALDDDLEDEDEMIVDEDTLSGFDNEEAEALKDWLQDEQGRYINEIFRNSADMYEQALQQIAQMAGWNEAAEYIRQQVFTPHQIDMFSETAIDFTDRLQSYFEEHKN